MRNFRNYDIWRNGMEIVDKVYTMVSLFPKYEIFGLSDQVRRAAVSIPSNIAEGSSRSSESDFSRFLEYSIGSCFEVETQIEIAKSRGYVNENEYSSLLDILQQEEKQLNQFISKLKAKG